MDFVLLCTRVEIAGDILISDFINSHGAEPFAGIKIPIEDDIVDKARGVIRAFRDAVTDVGEQIVVEVDVVLAGAVARRTGRCGTECWCRCPGRQDGRREARRTWTTG